RSARATPRAFATRSSASSAGASTSRSRRWRIRETSSASVMASDLASGGSGRLLLEPFEAAVDLAALQDRDHVVEVAVEDRGEVVEALLDPVVGDPVLREVVGPDLLAALAAADLFAAVARARALR